MSITQQGCYFNYKIAGISSVIGKVLGIDEWAKNFKVPNRKKPGSFLSGSDIQNIIGPVASKSWDPDFFRDFNHIIEIARTAMEDANVTAQDIDIVMVATSTPYEVQLDYDSFKLLRALEIPDHIPPLQLASGCAGMARALSLAAKLNVRNILIVTYEVSSLYMVSPIYRYNTHHPLNNALWASPALFSDGAAAIVLRHSPSANGYSLYSRDSLSFGDGEGFDDPLIHYPGGGALNPPGLEQSEQLSCYAMAGDKTKLYYSKGMKLNHQGLEIHRQHYFNEVERIYTHQASPNMVEGFIKMFSEETGVEQSKFSTNVRKYGNLVIPSTLKMIHDDINAKKLKSGDELAVMVVGAGPERGAFLIELE
ncbi:3-oxoacyl-[acyl-carrier-protein] synthase III C-terminal domain-containing protein [Serratia proteamaculans]|jgi:3-oxoacyl-[acyl-carrier-protein] synthase-3|uniref:3-oxoacyl-[acyl-carrier-protein] synthase III C-terminal domain-containing protein n=1 Tax=Serratia proteamaculans TaxID=28151 RepID=UPI000D919123|nr:3-oxoacyl-[acyl-carrier-protein] synthase III C-terminal domain-containing protein [Serratia proteamaculans]CAI0974369.1 PQB biosynthetic 3-oxoacyl-[acyl-carrier-protein] synthase III [Serratia proteamaculans]CAI1059436.1 PQB biosynthetic 3-oxoacyl-[acyl-carrier-protein] synthase III [Serratia proteamaculans]SPZ52638.1 PQB biosynthetic 3-oxoacyl-[acyl-carrier-protein] synthase III [Serratia quinivorans]